MEDFKIDLMIDSGPSARSVQIKLNPFTLIGATTLFDIQYNNPKLFSLQDSLNINIYNKLYNNDLNNYEI